jgi:HSP20 family protein
MLFQAFDDIVDTASKMFDSISVNSNNSSYVTTDGTFWIGDPIDFTPYRRWNDWIWNYPSYTFNYKINTPSYPVSNFGIDKDGNSIIEIAVSGFDKDEISVRREDLKIIVEGKKKDKKEEKDIKYVYKHIAEREFLLEFDGSSKWDYEKLDVKIKNGILKIVIPVLEQHKPSYKQYQITGEN